MDVFDKCIAWNDYRLTQAAGLYPPDDATIKTMVFGFIIATISAYLGFTTESGTEGVGRASTRAVVFSSVGIIVANVILVRLIFFIFPKAAGG